MKKNDAIKLFDGVPALAKALGITRHAIYQWPEQLPQATEDRVIGAAMRLGKLPGGDRRDRDRTTADGQVAVGGRIRNSATEAGAGKITPADNSGEAA